MRNFFLSLLVLVSVACADNDDDSSDEGASGGGGAANNPNVVSELLGTWSKPCSSAGAQGGFVKNSVIVDPVTASMASQIFQNSSTCVGSPDLEVRSNLNYTVPSFSAGQINQINMVVNSIRARFNTTEAAALANATGFCGFTDWQSGVEKDVAGQTCVAELPPAGQPFFSIFQIVQGNQLFIGQVDSTHNGKTPETRPTQLESTPYTK